MKIIPFNFKTGEVRALQDEQGEPWFVAKDICDRLGIKNSRDAVSKLSNDEKGVAKTDTLGGSQEVTIVNESGLYNLIFKSNKPEADSFRRWVTHEVLPSIRKTGSYSISKEAVSNDAVKYLDNDEILKLNRILNPDLKSGLPIRYDA